MSATGHGEFFIRSVVAYDIHALMDYKGLSLDKAVDEVVQRMQRKLKEMKAEGGVIAIDSDGHITMSFNSECERDLRYWTQRRASARLVETAPTPDTVRFGVKVTLESDDGSRREFRIVGEDEADPSQGRISWVSPLAVALIGAKLGDVVKFQGQDAEIVRLD